MADSSHAHAHVPPAAPTTKKSNKIRDIVRLQQMLKKWKKAATASSSSNNDKNAVAPTTTTTTTNNKTSTTKGLNKFLKKTLSFSDISNSSSSSYSVGGQQEEVVRKGYLAVWVGREEEGEMKKFVIPTDYLTHQAFSALLRDAEEEFGFQQEGILKIPCDVPLFEKILNMMTTHNNKKHHPPTLKSSSSTSSFFLYNDDQDHQQQPQPELLPPPPPPHQHDHQQRSTTNFDSQLKAPPTTPTHHLPLYCR